MAEQNGAAISIAGPSKTLTLPSGATAEVRKGRGKDLMRAHRAVRGKDDPMAIAFALIAELTNIDGKPIVYEDVLEMGLADVFALQTEIMGSDFQLPPLPSSPDSFNSDSQSRN
jgi:hypothetical protein